MCVLLSLVCLETKGEHPIPEDLKYVACAQRSKYVL